MGLYFYILKVKIFSCWGMLEIIIKQIVGFHLKIFYAFELNWSFFNYNLTSICRSMKNLSRGGLIMSLRSWSMCMKFVLNLISKAVCMCSTLVFCQIFFSGFKLSHSHTIFSFLTNG